MAEPHAVGLESLDGLLRKAATFTEKGEFSSMAARLGVKVHLHDLMESLKKIQALLSAADQTQISASADLRLWLKKVNELNAKADDLLDGFAYEARRPGAVEGHQDKKKRNKVCNFFSRCNSSVITRRKVIRGFKLVSSRYRYLAHEAHKFGLDLPERPVDATAKFEQIPQTTDYSSVVESHMFQGGDDSLALKKMLLSAGNDRDFFFVSIMGMGGIGKTTLAQVVYNDYEVVNHFDVRMWVYVGENFSIDRILKSLVECLTHMTVPDEMSGREEILLKLLDRLKGTRYLLVLDDVWVQDPQLTDQLNECLLKQGGSRGSKILVTTRSAQVAVLLQPGLSYRMGLGTEEYCWKLFQQVAFAPGGPEMTPRLMEMGEAIVKRCQGLPLAIKTIGGLPLAIKTIGGLLYTKKDEEEWNSIATSDTWLNDDPIPGALLLSYVHLPSISLKQCFLYCSTFPRGSVMEKDELIQLWNAQGLLNPPQGSGLSEKDLGARYLDTLVRTSFLENAEQDEVDRRKFYKMHYLLHGLASSLSKDQCSIMEGINIAANDLKLAAHMSLINCKAEILKSLRGKGMLRTLRLVNSGVLGDALAYTTSLRVLIVVDWHVDELPDSVSKLKLLHYLDISKTKILKLPDSISELYNLQTLRLYDLIELPKSFENLASLRHLYIERFKDLDRLSGLPPQFQKVINPSSFKACFKAHLHSKGQIEKLDTLLERPDLYYRLSIYCLENVDGYEEATEAKLSSMSTIECLRFHWNARRENYYDEDVLDGLQPHANIKNLAIENYKGSAFPSWIENTSHPLILHHLVKMELEDCSCCEQVPPLGHLPCLKIVKMQGMVKVKSIGAEFYGFTNVHDQCSTSSSASRVFPQLRELTLREMTSLEEWSEPANLSNHSSSICPLLEKFEVEQCPKLKCLPNVMTTSHRLRRLEVAMCDSLECLPEGVGGLASLEDLDIRGLPSLSQLSIGCFDNLKTLTIGGFSSAPEVDCNGQQTSQHLKGGDGKVASLPEQLQYLSALRFLTISGYGGLETLPEWISKLRSLQILKLEFCWKLAHFPASEKMQQLKNLDELEICYCPLLEARCIKGSRPELYKISHIPRIMINSEEIKFRPRNKNKNTTNTQSRRNKEKDIEESGNQERNEGEGEEQGRSAASSSSQPDQGINIHVQKLLSVSPLAAKANRLGEFNLAYLRS
ncbi:putative disease resistance protein RGA1 [Coffea eugenioides]|uniref:putative disease resistance protein RGA1 n=1 Tax=Coffea eugenioides TaxID=49369 RepID=UPI000F6065B8|nr:putative disease resistance protein RGA1 [Coffea eugenioides]